jgi:putative ABC transport system permease protein
MNSLVASNLTHHPGRTTASVIGVAVSVVLVVLTVGLVRGMLRDRGRRDASIGAEIMLSLAGQGGLSITSASLSLPVTELTAVRNVPGVAAASPVGQNLEMKGESGLGVRQMDGIEFDSYTAVSKLRLVQGEPLPASGDVAIVDVKYAADHQTRLGDTIEGLDRQFKIIGIYEPEAGARIKIPLATMQEALNAEGKCSMLFVKCQNPEEQEAVARRLLERSPDFRVILTRDLPELFATGFAGINSFLNLVAALAVVISMLVILLTMYTTVTERTRQIGILKSLGASKLFIAGVIEKEALLISALGVAGGLAFALVVRAVLVRMGVNIELEPGYILYAVLAGLMSGLIGALYPALRAASQDPVEALSYE